MCCGRLHYTEVQHTHKYFTCVESVIRLPSLLPHKTCALAKLLKTPPNFFSPKARGKIFIMLLSLHFPNFPLHFVLVRAKEGGYLQKDSLAGNVQWGMKRLPESCSFLILMTTQRKHASWLNVTMAAIVRHTHKERTNTDLDIHNQQTCIHTNTQSLCVHTYFCKHSTFHT